MLYIVAFLAIPPITLALVAYVVWWRQGKPKLGDPDAKRHSSKQEIDASVMRSNNLPPV